MQPPVAVALASHQLESPTLECKAARPCIAFGAAPDLCQNRGPGRTQPGWDLRFSQELVMKNTKAFLIGFVAASTPILIYTAWITWHIAEAI
jgi:hypothetical protein